MNKWLKAILVLICLALLIHLISLFANSEEGFISGFWQNFYSDIIVGIAITYFVTWYINQSKAIDIEVIGYLEDTDNDSKKIVFILLNKGQVSFDERRVYYHIMLVQKFENFISDMDSVKKVQTVEGKLIFKLDGLIDGPVYPKRPCKVCELNLKNYKETEFLNPDMGIFYFLSTPNGVIPKSAVLEGELGIKWGNLGKVKFMDKKMLKDNITL